MAEKFSFDKPQNVIIAVLAIAVIVLGYFQLSGAAIMPGQVSGDKASQAALAFINKNLIKPGDPEVQKEGEVSQESGLYKFNVKVGEQTFPIYVTRDGAFLFAQNPIKIQDSTTTDTATDDQNPPTADATTIGDFSIKADKEVCLENGKPIVYFFGSESCPHCTWEKPVIQAVADKFNAVISFHRNIDNNADIDVFSQYSDGGIPTIVAGCKYYRVGSGENAGEDGETQALTALMCKLTNGEPGEICAAVADLVAQIQ